MGLVRSNPLTAQQWLAGRTLGAGLLLAISAWASPGLAQSDADARLEAPPPAPAAAPGAPKSDRGAALEKALKGIHGDGPIKLSDTVQADLLALLPAARRGEECPTAATASPDAIAIKDRGDGAVIVAQIVNCQGSFVMAYSTGVVLRASRLLNLEEGQTLADAHPLNLRGTHREDDLAIALHSGLTRDELHLLLRRGEGFTFVDTGTLKEFGEKGDCSAGGEVTGGYSSFLRVDAKSRLEVLRVDTSCAGGNAWMARCELWTIEGGPAQNGVCALPAKLDAKSLRGSGWR